VSSSRGDPALGLGFDVTFSPSSAFALVRYSRDFELRHTDTGEIVLLTDNVDYSEFSPDGQFLVVQYSDKPTELRNARTGELVSSLGESKVSVTFSLNSKFVQVTNDDKSSKLYRTDNGMIVPLTSDLIERLTFSPNDEFAIVWYSSVISAELRRIEMNEVVVRLNGKELIGASFSPDSKSVGLQYVVNDAFMKVDLHHTDTGRVVASIPAFVGPVNTVNFSPNSIYMAVEYEESDQYILTDLYHTDSGGYVSLTTDEI
jgi:WD40 repeat protein